MQPNSMLRAIAAVAAIAIVRPVHCQVLQYDVSSLNGGYAYNLN